MRGFNAKLFGDKLVAGQLPTQLGLIGSTNVTPVPVFEFSVKTDNAGVSTSTQFRMPLTTSTGLNFSVDWGDGVTETIINHTLAIHTYSSAGTYTIAVTGNILGWQFNDAGDRLKMLNVFQWKALNISVVSAFFGCANLTSNATDAPTISTTALNSTFRGCNSLQGGIQNWNLLGVTNIRDMFRESTSNADITLWNTSTVEIFDAMFFSNTGFNQNISTWNTSSATSFSAMFYGCSAFNQPLGTWVTTSVTNMANMFDGATAFNQNIGAWNVSNVTSFTNFMNGKTAANYSAANLDSLYNGWSSRAVIANRSISFGSIKYTAASVAGRLILTSAPNNWTITDGGI
jgi:surface protein